MEVGQDIVKGRRGPGRRDVSSGPPLQLPIKYLYAQFHLGPVILESLGEENITAFYTWSQGENHWPRALAGTSKSSLSLC